MSVTGFGICGQKNVYSCRTKCGNWVEDRIGKVVAAKLKDAPRPSVGSTVERDDFIPPARMKNNTVLSADKAEMLSAADIKEKNVSGVSFDLLFGHVRDGKHADVLQQDRFMTNTWESFSTGNSSITTSGTTPSSRSVRRGCTSIYQTRTRQRVTDIARERRQVEALTTTARLQGARAS
eukprot:jgi/Undpi1/6964/HiC_scaffold_21.g09438.m1